MSRTIPKSTIETVRTRNDIVDVIGTYLPLKKAGGRYKALCPFHHEKTPSFVVTPGTQSYHCFGCGQGGDVFKFVMAHEHLDFIGAIQHLAARAGVRLEYEESGDAAATGPNRTTLLGVLGDAAKWFHQQLLETTEAQPARDYLASRDLDAAVINKFLFGYAPASTPALMAWAKKKGFTPDLLELTGLAARAETPDPGRPDRYARFRRRLMIPIRNEGGKVVGFTGRVLDPQQPGGKYVNSPETAVFQKGHILFGFDLARETILERRCAVLCEGQIDAIRCHQAGFTNAVAAQGTALTEDHVRLLKRFTDSVIVVLDADEAGEKAALRAAELFLPAGFTVRLARLPPDEDPDSLIRQQGADAFRALLERATSAIEFYLALSAGRGDLNNESGLLRTMQTLAGLLQKTPEILRDRYIQQAANGLQPYVQADQLTVLEKNLRVSVRRLDRKESLTPPRDGGGASPVLPAIHHPPQELALVELLLTEAAQDHGSGGGRPVADLAAQYLPLAEVSDPACRTLIVAALRRPPGAAWNPLDEFDRNDQAGMQFVTRLQAMPPKAGGGEVSLVAAAQDVIVRICLRALERRRQTARAALAAALPAAREALEMQCHELALDISRLKQGWDKAHQLLQQIWPPAP